jgi:hypothetical protein
VTAELPFVIGLAKPQSAQGAGAFDDPIFANSFE